MRLFVANLAIAFLAMAATGFWSMGGFLAGMALGAALLSLIPARRQPGRARPPGYGGRVWRVGRLVLMFLKELGLSALRVARIALTPGLPLNSGIFAYPLTVDRDFEIALLANLITLTPGTLSVDVSADRRTLYVHAIDCTDVEAARRDIRDGFERAILEAFR